LSDQTAVVVGVGPGLGVALVTAFADEGYIVFAAARRADSLDQLEGLIADGKVVAVNCDTTVPQQVDALFAAAAEHGALRVTVFNAGAFAPGNVVDSDPDEFERCWRVGCFGGFLVGRAAARLMLSDKQGTIIFTGATASLRGGAGFANLAAPKFALRALAQSMSRELGPQGIHVAHVIIDGQIHVARYEDLLAERGPDSLLEPAAIADSYVNLHRQPRNAWSQEIELRPWVEKF